MNLHVQGVERKAVWLFERVQAEVEGGAGRGGTGVRHIRRWCQVMSHAPWGSCSGVQIRRHTTWPTLCIPHDGSEIIPPEYFIFDQRHRTDEGK